ncbi:MAG: hypothetical protein IK008_00615 [Bacteroidales bacterium]|nr:hypothetical protein [Bacteroidales bacterium]
MSFLERIGLRKGGLGREWIFLVLSVLVAFLVWVLTNLSKNYSGTVSVPVVAQCNIEGHGTESTNTVLVSARCRADGFRLLRENSRRERKVVKVRFDRADMRKIGPDTYAVIGGTKNSYTTQFFGDKVQVEAFITDTLKFVFPVENYKRVPVEVPHSVTFAPQFMPCGPFSVSPDTITVYGDDAHLGAVDKVSSSLLELTEVEESQHGVVRLNVPDGIRLSADQVSYELPVTRYVELQTTLPVGVLNAPAGRQLQVYPATARLVLRCAFPIAKDPLESFKLYIDWQEFNTSLTGRCVPRVVKLPVGVLDYRVEPEVFDCVEL